MEKYMFSVFFSSVCFFPLCLHFFLCYTRQHFDTFCHSYTACHDLFHEMLENVTLQFLYQFFGASIHGTFTRSVLISFNMESETF